MPADKGCDVEEIEEPVELVERVAALDIGKAALEACVRVPHPTRPRRRCQEVRAYPTTTCALVELADWLRAERVTLVVIEATSTYYKAPYYLLEGEFTCWLVNAGRSRTCPAGPRPTGRMRSGWPRSPSGACVGPASCRPSRSASCGT
jgi:transposase